MPTTGFSDEPMVSYVPRIFEERRVYKRWLSTLTVLSWVAVVSGCAYQGFGFPVQEGNVEAGRQAFIDHKCHQCHSVAGIRLPPLAGASPVMLELGGATAEVKNYAELMTSVINPDHAISEKYRERLRLEGGVPLESPMPTPEIDNMTVRQLLDMVAFLDSRYVQVEGYRSDY